MDPRRCLVLGFVSGVWAMAGCHGASNVASSPFGMAGDSAKGDSNSASKIDGRLAAQMQRASRTAALIELADKADLAPAVLIPDRTQKIRFVYDSLRRTAATSQQSLLAWLGARGIKHQSFYISNLIAVDDVDADTLLGIAARADVERVHSNAAVRMIPSVPASARLPSGTVNPDTGPEPNLVRMGADRVWTQLGVQGEGIVVAGQDTGVQWDHPALKAQYRGFDGTTANHDYSWHDAIHAAIIGGSTCGYDVATPCDDYGHGSHTMGTIVGDDGQGNQIGMAPKAKWMACRNMDGGTGRPSTYIECYEWMLAPYPQGADPQTAGDPSKAPHVVNNSWGCDTTEECTGQEIVPVLKSMKAAGIMIVASAGNDGPDCGSIASQPASITDFTLSVGAFDHRTDQIAGFSSRGPSSFDGAQGPDVAAPGVSIRSSVPGGVYEGGWSGTSMAGPHVAGEVALLWSADATLIGQIDETTNVIRKTAEPKTSTQSCGDVLGSQVPNDTFGYGLANVFGAVSSRRSSNLRGK